MTRVPHLYLHVPFCRRQCPYCDYAMTASDPPDLDRWSDAIRQELRLLEDAERPAEPLETLQIGGGTPSTLGAALPGAVRALLGEGCVRGVGEWSVEANPEDLSAPLLSDWVAGGVTRVSLGLQDVSAAALRWLGRGHDPELGERALDALSRSGLESWGVDLLFGLPAACDPAPESSLEAALRVGAPHVSLYELTAEPGTLLGEQVAAGAVSEVDGDSKAEAYLRLAGRLEEEGYVAYAFTAFARPGHESRQLRAVLRGAPFLGLGPGAHTRIGGFARENLRDWREYAGMVEGGRLPRIAGGSGEDRRLVGWASRLRLREGIPLGEVGAPARALARRWVDEGWAHPDPDRLRLTHEGWLRLDTLVLRLDGVEEGPG